MTYLNNNVCAGQCRRFVKTLYFFSNIAGYVAAKSYYYWSQYYKKQTREAADNYYLTFPILAVFIYAAILGLKSMLEKEFENKIVVSSNTAKKSGSKKKSIGFQDSLYLMFNSKLLLCLSALSLFYNISANLFDSASSGGMAASASCLENEKSSYSAYYKTLDGQCTSIGTAIIILSPLSYLIDKYGVQIFAYVPLIIVLISTIVELGISTVNYPFTGQECMWPFNKFAATTTYATAESVISTFIQVGIKISKYAFFDVVKESFSMKIDPSLRPLFKGVFDGSMAKFGKCAGSIYGIIMAIFFDCVDNRYYFPITALVLIAFCIFWHYSIQYLNSSYKIALKANTFMDPDFKEKINL